MGGALSSNVIPDTQLFGGDKFQVLSTELYNGQYRVSQAGDERRDFGVFFVRFNEYVQSVVTTAFQGDFAEVKVIRGKFLKFLKESTPVVVAHRWERSKSLQAEITPLIEGFLLSLSRYAFYKTTIAARSLEMTADRRAQINSLKDAIGEDVKVLVGQLSSFGTNVKMSTDRNTQTEQVKYHRERLRQLVEAFDSNLNKSIELRKTMIGEQKYFINDSDLFDWWRYGLALSASSKIPMDTVHDNLNVNNYTYNRAKSTFSEKSLYEAQGTGWVPVNARAAFVSVEANNWKPGWDLHMQRAAKQTYTQYDLERESFLTGMEQYSSLVSVKVCGGK